MFCQISEEEEEGYSDLGEGRFAVVLCEWLSVALVLWKLFWLILSRQLSEKSKGFVLLLL